MRVTSNPQWVKLSQALVPFDLVGLPGVDFGFGEFFLWNLLTSCEHAPVARKPRRERVEDEENVTEQAPTIDMPTEPRRSERQRKPPSKYVGFGLRLL